MLTLIILITTLSANWCIYTVAETVNNKAESETYKAAVIEYHPVDNSSLTNLERLYKNTDEYVRIINNLNEVSNNSLFIN